MTGRNIGLLLCVLFSFAQSNPVEFTEAKRPFSIEEAILGQLSVSSYNGKWISDNEIEYMDKTTKDVKVFNVAKNQTGVVLKGSILQKYNATKYEFSPDRKFVLLCYDEKAVFRHSKIMKFTVYSVKDGKYYDYGEHVQIVEWSPKNNMLVFIKENDIYLIRDVTSKMDATRITHDGKRSSVFNGIGDWVYEEEILSSGEAFWFSPNGDQLAFLTLFDDKVQKVVIEEYGEPGDLKNQYTNLVNISYPKAGSGNPVYELRHVNFNSNKISVLTKYGPGKEVFYSLKWIDNESVMYVVTNRIQNESKIFQQEVKPNGALRVVFKENNTKGWANVNLPIVKKNRSVRIEGIPVGQLGKFKHLVMYPSSGTSYPLTGGPFEVLNVVHWDDTKKIIYYSATEENSATSTQIYAIGESKGSKPVCLTCQIKSPEGRGCKEASASFSKNGSYVIVNCNGPDPKVVSVYKNAQPLGKSLGVLEDNSKLRTQLKKKLLPEVMNLTVEVPGPFKADVRLFLPPNLDRTGKTKYPLVIYVQIDTHFDSNIADNVNGVIKLRAGNPHYSVTPRKFKLVGTHERYGGPASKNINDAFKMDWALYMTTNLSVIYGLIDGRNTLRKGENMLFAGYKALGTLEMEDQINVTRSLQKQLPFIDSARTGIWGWSYGGYATTKILEIDTQNVFKCGIAVAPVADWIYYDSMYTERYMGVPQENKKGYEMSSVLKDASNLRNKQYFLIHGNADDNVHYQNAMMIAKLLERNNIPFELMSYPDEDHGLKHVRKHLYYTMSRFWKKCFNLSK